MAPHAHDGEPIRRSVRARSADAALLPRLGAGLRGRVHSVFARVVNVEADGGGLVTLAGADVDDAPDTIIAGIAGFDHAGIECGDPFVATRWKLRVGPVEVGLSGASWWSATLPAYPRDDTALATNLRIAAARLGAGDAGAVGTPRPAAGDPFARDAAAALERHARRLLGALARRDLDASRGAALAMIGLGPGLTPSGDDYLVGLLAALNLPGSPCHAMRVIGPGVVAAARCRTNAISLAALANAARGRVRDSIASLLRTLLGEAPQRVAPALERVLAIGSSSGREIAAGMLSGLELQVQAP